VGKLEVNSLSLKSFIIIERSASLKKVARVVVGRMRIGLLRKRSLRAAISLL
jgi:hypothetical protein